MPEWLAALASLSLISGLACTLVVVIDIWRGKRQHMWIMNAVWPLTTLYSGVFGLWAYFKIGRQKSPSSTERPQWQAVALATTHCGAGCTLADILVESVLSVVPLTLFGHVIFASWTLDYVAAFAFGIAFQYFTIRPMQRLSRLQALIMAIKADAASLTAWQLGMYAWMAIATFSIFGREIAKTSPVFWFMMQLGMVAGLLTSYPVNAWLIRSGVKERM